MAGFDPSCIDVEHFLNALEVRNLSKATEHEFRFSCPFPNHDGGDERPSCYMNIDTSAFFCHGCKERGNAVSLTQHVLSVSPLEAVRLLRESYQPGAINPDARDMESEIKSILNAGNTHNNFLVRGSYDLLDEQILADMLVAWEEVASGLEGGSPVPRALAYMLERGFDPGTLNDWEFGYDGLSDRPIFPVRSAEGELIGFKGRAWRPEQQPKYLVLGDRPGKAVRYGFSCYQTSRVVFGANRLDKVEKLVVCEGELNAVATNMKTGMPAVAINGSYFSDFHSEIIKSKTEEVILFLDSDEAGRRGTWGWDDSNGIHHPGIVDSLTPFLDVRVCPEHKGDAASMSPGEIQECLDKSQHWLSFSLTFAKIPNLSGGKQ